MTNPTPSTIQPIRLTDWILLLFLGFCWGSSFTVTAELVQDFNPLVVVFLRVSVAALVLIVIGFFRKSAQHSLAPTFRLALSLALTLNVIPFLLIVWAQQFVASGVASIFNALTPIASMSIALLLVPGEKFSGRKLMAIVIGILGIVVMAGWDSFVDQQTSPFAMLALVLATCCYGLGANFIYRWRRENDSLVLICRNQLVLSTLLLTPFLIFLEPSSISDNPYHWFLALWYGIVSTALAYMLFYSIIKRIGPINGSLVTFIAPIVALLLGGLLLNEHFKPTHYLGMGLIFTALMIIHYTQKAKIQWQQ